MLTKHQRDRSGNNAATSRRSPKFFPVKKQTPSGGFPLDGVLSFNSVSFTGTDEWVCRFHAD
jgi:hypothetical protein